MGKVQEGDAKMKEGIGLYANHLTFGEGARSTAQPTRARADASRARRGCSQDAEDLHALAPGVGWRCAGVRGGRYALPVAALPSCRRWHHGRLLQADCRCCRCASRWLAPRAVKAYKIAKAPEKLVEANTQLANALGEANSFYNAGNALSAAGDASVELNNLAGATQYYEQACQRYREGDSEKMAALVLAKCGK